MKQFKDRRQAGAILGRALAEYAGRTDVVVLALPRGGVPVAYEIAAVLGVPLDVFLVRKLGAPWNEEFAIGALASDGISVIDRQMVAQLGISQSEIASIMERETLELERRDKLYRGDRPWPDVTGKVVILVDDGLATGATMRAGVEALRARHPAQIIATAPVASRQACEMLQKAADKCICLASPEPFFGVGRWYEDFSQTTDREVLRLLESADRWHLEETVPGMK